MSCLLQKVRVTAAVQMRMTKRWVRNRAHHQATTAAMIRAAGTAAVKAAAIKKATNSMMDIQQ